MKTYPEFVVLFFLSTTLETPENHLVKFFAT